MRRLLENVVIVVLKAKQFCKGNRTCTQPDLCLSLSLGALVFLNSIFMFSVSDSRKNIDGNLRFCLN